VPLPSLVVLALTPATVGIAAGFPLSIINYFVLGWASDIDGYYMHSFEIWLACLVVFPGAGSLAFALLEYRLGQRSFFGSVLETITWIPFLFVIPPPLSRAR
jgi:hypothetical protein